MSVIYDLGGNTVITENIRVGATGPGQTGTDISSAEIAVLDGVTAGTVTASKAVVVDASKNIATFGTIGSAAHTITSSGASALAVGRQGATAPALKVDASTASSATGVEVVAAAAAGGVNVRAISSGTDENLTINAKGAGTIGIAPTSTGAVTITPATTVTGVLTATAGVTSPAGATWKSGTAVPATAGAVAAGAPITCFSSGWKLWVTSDAPTHSATKGDLCINTGGSSSSTRLYVNNGTTTWIAITTAS